MQSSKTLTNEQLRAKFIELIKAQNKPYGLLIDDIAGGFTLTGRGQRQAFQVEPLVVYKVFADGRPDELVRGVDIVGTPLASSDKDCGNRRYAGSVQRLLWGGVGLGASFGSGTSDTDVRTGSAEESDVIGPTTYFATTRA